MQLALLKNPLSGGLLSFCPVPGNQQPPVALNNANNDKNKDEQRNHCAERAMHLETPATIVEQRAHCNAAQKTVKHRCGPLTPTLFFWQITGISLYMMHRSLLQHGAGRLKLDGYRGGRRAAGRCPASGRLAEVKHLVHVSAKQGMAGLQDRQRQLRQR